VCHPAAAALLLVGLVEGEAVGIVYEGGIAEQLAGYVSSSDSTIIITKANFPVVVVVVVVVMDVHWTWNESALGCLNAP